MVSHEESGLQNTAGMFIQNYTSMSGQLCGQAINIDQFIMYRWWKRQKRWTDRESRDNNELTQQDTQTRNY